MDVSSFIKKFLRYTLITALMILFTLPAFATNTILIVGDSLSSGYNMESDESWPALLQSQLKEDGYDYEVINSSVSGDTTSNGLAKMDALLQQYHPQITLIELGGNDGLRGLQLLTIQGNLQKMISLAQNAGSKVLLLGLRLPPNYGPDYVAQFQALYRTLADKNDIPLVENILKNIDDHKELMSADGIHPVSKGQAIILANVWEQLKPLLAR